MVSARLARFAAAGTLGFVVDAGVLYLSVYAGANWYTGRLISFVAAVVATWLINRRWTFGAHSVRPTFTEFGRYLGAMVVGASANYATYALVILLLPHARWLPLLGVALGSIVGLGVNYSTASKWVYGDVAPATPPLPRRPWPAPAFWASLGAGIIGLKFLGLAIDPQPGLFLGDSASYLHTALTDGVPSDRSYWYGVIVRHVIGETESLTPLLVVQSIAGAATALLAAWWSHLVFRPPRCVLCVVAILCALEPSQLLFERYVMTEALALLCLAIQIVGATYLIVRGDWRWMPLVLLAAIAVVALRLSLLPVVAAICLTAPLLAWTTGRLRSGAVLATLASNLVLLAAVPPVIANIYGGPFLLGAWSPLLQASDFDDSAFGERAMNGIVLNNGELFTREANVWHPGGLMQRLKSEYPGVEQLDRVTRRAALNILKRDPMGVAVLGWRTYASVWNPETRLRLMQWDVGAIPRDPGLREAVSRAFRLVIDELPAPTAASRLYLSLGLWLSMLYLAAPVLLAGAWARVRGDQAAAIALLILASAGVILILSLMTTLPVIRYLHPVSWMLVAALVPLVMQSVLRAYSRVSAVGASSPLPLPPG